MKIIKKSKLEIKQEENKQILISASNARSTLYLMGFINESQNDKIQAKLMKFKVRNKIVVKRDEF